MVVRRGSAGGRVAAAPDEVFATVVDIDRLPEWNSVIREVVQRPAELESGAEWVVEMKAPGMPAWRSRSKVVAMDAAARRFRHESRTDDGNPSWSVWEWRVDDAPGGADVSVSWELHPETFLRKHVFSRIRNRALRREVPASVAAMGAVVTGGVS